jgi:hypothetical protein
MYLKVEITNGVDTHAYYYDIGSVHIHGAGLASNILAKAGQGWQTTSKPKPVNHCPDGYEEYRGELGGSRVRLYCTAAGRDLLDFS